MHTNFRLFKAASYVTLILFLFSVSCRKVDIANPEIVQDSKQSTAKFFSLPAGIDPEIKKVAANLQKQSSCEQSSRLYSEKWNPEVG